MIEAILAGSILILFSSSIFGAFYYGISSSKTSADLARGGFLVDEGIEAVRNIADDNFQSLQDGTYGLTHNGITWSLQATPDTTDIFTRTITISSLDANRKQVVSMVSWQKTAQRDGEISALTYITNWRGPQEWENPILGPCLNIAGGQDSRKIALQGEYAFVVTDSSGESLVAVNVSNQGAPFQADSLGLQNNPQNIFLHNNKALITTRNNSGEFQTVSISDPTNLGLPVLVNLPGAADAFGVYASGNYAYVARGAGFEEFHSLNVSTNPIQQSDVQELLYDANEIYISGNFAYVASTDDNNELKVVDISNPTSLSFEGAYNESGNSADGVTVTGFGDYVFLGKSNGQIQIFKVSTPSSPELVGVYNAGTTVNDLAVGPSNSMLFAAVNSGARELQIIDLSNIAAPSLIGSYNADDSFNGVAYSASQNLVFVVGSSNSANFCAIEPF